MRDKEELDILTGLLDFYSDRATAHASFVIAGIFGIYTVLFAESELPLPVFIPTYLALVFIVVYSFLNFGYWATLADIVRTEFGGTKYETKIYKELKRRNRPFHIFRLIKDFGMKGSWRLGHFL